MHSFKITFSIIGRILLGAIFILAAINKIMYWDESVMTLQTTLENWKSYGGPNALFGGISLIQQHLDFSLGLALGFEMLGGLLVLIGVVPRFGAILLILFLIPTTIVFHPFWYMIPPERDTQLISFMKNLSILGGVFLVFAFGSGFRSKSNM